MKFCIFSDIHGNGPAFKVAYPMIMNEKADINIFLGDLCGYYFDQNSIFDMIQSIPNLVAVLGNHDSYFLRVVDGDKSLKNDYCKKYGTSIDRLLDSSPTELVKWFTRLPQNYMLRELGISTYHGSPWDTIEGYVYPDSLLEGFLDYDASVFFLGHTHYPMVKNVNNKMIVNPGSLGQPRNGGWPTYAVFDYDSKKVSYREVNYDKNELLHKLQEIGDDNQYLRFVLNRKKDHDKT